MRHGDCAYCGEWRELTRDHVPPRCLFSRPRPGNLVTVPCCSSCNHELSKEDEYFRLVIMAGIDSRKFPKENSDSVRAINSLNRPASRKFAKKVLQSYERNPARLRVDRSRIEIVLHRIARGLFYHHRGVRLPQTVPFDFRDVDDSLNVPALGRELISLLERNLSTIGQETFRYAHGFEPWPEPDPFGTIWLMRFYDHRTFFCATASNWCGLRPPQHAHRTPLRRQLRKMRPGAYL